MQTWIIIIGVLVLAGIGLDMVRRTRNAGRDSFEMDLNMQQGLDQNDLLAGDAEEDYLPELPAGGARKVERGEESQKVQKVKEEPTLGTPVDLEETQKFRVSPSVPSSSSGDDQGSDEPVPMLMESGSYQEASFHDNDDPFMGGSTPILSRPRVVARKSKEESQPNAAAQEPAEVIVINVMAKQPEGLEGAALLETVLASGLRYGEMNIFHYHLSSEDNTSLFSMANIVKPGTFDLNNMKSFQTPGVSLFMALPLKDKEASAMDTFDKMLTCAKNIAQNLGGDLRDENRSVMTGQTIEHCRQRISEFSRLALSRSGKHTPS